MHLGAAGCEAWIEPTSMVSAHVRSLSWLAGTLAGGLPGLTRRFAGLAGRVAGFDRGLTRFDRFVL